MLTPPCFSERSLDLVLTLDNSPGRPFLFVSVSGVRLGQVLPNASTEFSVEVIALTEGLQVGA